MKKYAYIVMASLVLVAMLGLCIRYSRPQLVFTERVQGMLLRPWSDPTTGQTYLFLPSYTTPADIEQPIPQGITVLQSRHLPAIFVELGRGELETLHLYKRFKADAVVAVVAADGTLTESRHCQISGRGNSSWGYDKKPYNLHFGAGETWCLVSNARDTSQIRNALSYHIARKVGIPYTSDIEYVTLYVNGVYNGLYAKASKKDYMPDVGKSVEAVFEKTIDMQVYNYISAAECHIRYRYGDGDRIVQAVDRMEKALFDSAATLQSVAQRIDTATLARKFFVEMLTANYDLKCSQYYAIDADERITAICAWDYDMGFGTNQFSGIELAPNQIIKEHPWYYRLADFDEFRHRCLALCQQYTEDIADTEAFADSVADLISDDWTADNIRWGRLVTDIGTLDKHLDYIKQYQRRRIDFLMEYWRNPADFHELTLTNLAIEQDYDKHIRLYYKHGDSITIDNLPHGLAEHPDYGIDAWTTSNGLTLLGIGRLTKDLAFTIHKPLQPAGDVGLVPVAKAILAAFLVVFAFIIWRAW